MFEVFSLEEESKWALALDSIAECDFYFSPAYQKADAIGYGKPFLLSFSEGEDHIVFPLVLRPIENTDYFDVTSAYGYLGPISRRSNPGESAVTSFRENLNAWLLDNRCVAAFSRLHPLVQQRHLLDGLGVIREVGPTVSIDLTVDEKLQRRGYRKGTKSDIKKLEKQGVHIVEASFSNGIDDFVRLYEDNMKRLDADSSYYFSPRYYEALFAPSPEFRAELVFAEYGGALVSGAIFLISNQYVQYHLAGSQRLDFGGSPSRMIIDFVRRKYSGLQQRFLHLGGGVGAGQDHLFGFKSGFSDSRHQFSVWQYIVDEALYNQLAGAPPKDSSFFPSYR